MAHSDTAKPPTFGLPVSVTGPADLGRLIRELEIIDNTLMQLSLRSGGSEVKMPKTTQLMDQVIEANKLNLLQQTHRTALRQFLMTIKERAPVLHMSFSVDPPASFIETLVTWLRREIHPMALLGVGLQPNIGAGCVVRTTNKQFDFSLRQDFQKKRDLLLSQLAAPAAKPATPAPVPAQAPAPESAAPEASA